MMDRQRLRILDKVHHQPHNLPRLDLTRSRAAPSTKEYSVLDL